MIVALKVPIGLLDIPAKQAQEVYEYDLEKSSHTAIFASQDMGNRRFYKR